MIVLPPAVLIMLSPVPVISALYTLFQKSKFETSTLHNPDSSKHIYEETKAGRGEDDLTLMTFFLPSMLSI